MTAIHARAILWCLVIACCAAIPLARAASDDVAENWQVSEYRLAAAVEARNLDAIMKSYISDETLFVFDVIPPRQGTSAPRRFVRTGMSF